MGQAPQADKEAAYREALVKATATIRRLVDENAALNARPEVAVIGMACRFPGGANDIDRFWGHLRDGKDAIADVPPSRWPGASHLSADRDAPGRTYTTKGGFLDQPVADFDAAFFGIAPREAQALDPQHRLLLEVAWEALEEACLDPTALKGSRTGVFVGMSSDDYVLAHRHSGRPELIDAYSMTGSTFSTAVGRLSYLLGLHGPALAVDTACSSSLVALHLACRSLRSGESDLALVGGVNLILSPHSHICFSKLRAISPEGRCKTFDAVADGYVRGEGCGFVVLKRLGDAERDGNRLFARIRGSAVNQDGRTNGLAAPNGRAQQEVLAAALEDAGLAPDQVDYVEAHGTGTLLGDPIEAEALGAVFGGARTRKLGIGSVKTNIGHLEAAAGMAGLIKLILALGHQELPASLHFSKPNPHIPWDDLALTVTAERRPWPRSARPRIAGLSSFGFSGTNAHVLVEEAPAEAPRAPAADLGSYLLCLSAEGDDSLGALAAAYRDRLKGLDSDAAVLGDLCRSAAAGRRHFTHRLAVEGADAAALADGLGAFLDRRLQPEVAAGRCHDRADGRLAFLFTGQGAQYPGMGRELYGAQPAFRDAFDRCDALLRPLLGRSLTDLTFTGDAEALNRTDIAQPALFALEYALARMWAAWGVTPDMVIGHSVGEYAAACVAGVFSLEDGLTLVAERGRLMQALPAGGGMAAVAAAPAIMTEHLAPFAGKLEVAARNGPENLVISGPLAALGELMESLAGTGITVTPLAVSHAFHSHLMEPMLAAFERTVAGIALSPPRLPLISNLTGAPAGVEIATPAYWVDHVRRPVAFADGMETLARAGIRTFLELGPHATLSGMGRACVTGESVWLPSLRKGTHGLRTAHRALASLYVGGTAPDWAEIFGGQERRWMSLPHYSYRRRRHWIDSPALTGAVTAPSVGPAPAPLLDRMVRSPLLDAILFETRLGTQTLPLLAEHRIFGTVVVAGASLMAMILGAATRAFGEGVTRLADLMLHQALVIPDGESRLVHLALTPTGDRQAAFRLVAMAENATPGSETLHATGIVTVGAAAPPPPLPLAALLEKEGALTAELSGTAVRDAHARRHITLGPSYVWLDSMRLDAGESVGRLRPPDTDPPLAADGYRLHPGLLDSWLSLLAAMVGVEGDRPLVPFAVAELTLIRPLGKERLTAYARRRTLPDTPERIVGDLWLMDEAGALVAECRGLEGRHGAMDTLLRGAAPVPESCFHQIQWRAAAPAASASTADPWLIFTDGDGVGEGLAAHLRARGNPVTQVRPGQGFSRDGRIYQIDPLAAAHMAELVEAACPAGDRPIRVAYLWGLDARTEDGTALEPILLGSLAPLLHLVQALARRSGAPPSLAVVTRGALAADPADAVEPAQAPLAGLVKTVALEHPELGIRQTDLDPDGTVPPPDLLLSALLAADGETQTAHRGGERRVARLARMRPPASEKPLPVRGDRGYVIFGGLGGLGRHVARRLVARGARHLTLCGRGATAETAAFAAKLGEGGARVAIIRADLTRGEEVAAALAQAEAEIPVAGIVHAAGLLEDAMLARLTLDQLRRVLAAKTVGLRHLDHHSRALSLDFFLCFSSMVSLMGAAGQGAYAAANAYADALMLARRAEGLPGLAVNWGPWGETGMAARLDDPQSRRLARMGLLALPPETALDALERVAAGGLAQIGIANIDWPTFFRHAPQAQDQPLLALLRPDRATGTGTGWLNRLRRTPPAARRALLATLLRDEIGQVLGGNLEGLSPRRPLFDLGMDSLMAVDLRGRLSSALEHPLATTLLFDYPTLEALTDHLGTLLPDSPVEAAVAPAADGAAELDLLSDNELETLLAAKLGALEEGGRP